MTLQERVLEALGEKAWKPPALYAALSGELASAIDFALQALMKRGAVTFELGHYQRAASRVPSSGNGAVPSSDKLSKRERETWALVSSGLTNKQVAERLQISDSNVSVTLCSARKKLGIKVPAAHSAKAADAPRPNATPPAAPKPRITVSARIVQALEQRRADLAASIEAAEVELAGKREELADLVQFLNWLATQTGRA